MGAAAPQGPVAFLMTAQADRVVILRTVAGIVQPKRDQSSDPAAAPRLYVQRGRAVTGFATAPLSHVARIPENFAHQGLTECGGLDGMATDADLRPDIGRLVRCGFGRNRLFGFRQLPSGRLRRELARKVDERRRDVISLRRIGRRPGIRPDRLRASSLQLVGIRHQSREGGVIIVSRRSRGWDLPGADHRGADLIQIEFHGLGRREPGKCQQRANQARHSRPDARTARGTRALFRTLGSRQKQVKGESRPEISHVPAQSPWAPSIQWPRLDAIFVAEKSQLIDVKAAYRLPLISTARHFYNSQT
jgi:hypothetical protein